MAQTILLNFLIAALVFMLISRKLFSFIKSRYGGQGVKYKANVIFCGIIAVSAVPVVFLTFNEFLMLTAVVLIAYFFRKNLLAFSQKILSKKNGKIMFAAVALACGMVGCQADTDTEQIDIEQNVQASQQIDITATVKQATEQTSKLIETATEITSSIVVTKEVSTDIAVSREYEFDLEKYLENHDQYWIRNKLDFLSDEQYDTYIKAWIFIDNLEYFNIPYTGDIPTHFLDENGDVYENYFTEGAYIEHIFPYGYISTYQSFYQYLQSVFTRDAADEIMSHSFFKTVGDELYFGYGEKGGPIDVQTGRYELNESSDSEIIFEYIVDHYHDGNEWTTSHTIKLINTDNGWRSEIFEYLKR